LDYSRVTQTDFSGLFEAEVAVVAGATEETGAFVFDAPALFAEAAFLA
jgi:hypothetical protein